uniref:Uncharacterized protein n=1 Tax=Pyrodinium bahamense TaxID=73915 RepID=A0A7S0ALF4_9DINO|mmetsp:Transcript_36108/g.100228  ORF Transcript_36108/g.100228 Transcript_36108/m.100228 type:complete len:413 (+) Transcript_36108:152-1390(+)
MSNLYFVCDRDKIVFTFSAVGDGSWRFSRLSRFHKAKGLEHFVLLHDAARGSPNGPWVVQDQSAKGEIIGEPSSRALEGWVPGRGPPLGPWLLWGSSFTLADCTPRRRPLVPDPPFPIEVPFATLNYFEQGTVARLEVTMHSAPITDDVLEQVLWRLKAVLRSLAQRPEMVLLIRSDARDAAMPAVRHVKRFLRFVQENGSEFVLVGRGNAMVLRAGGLLAASLLALLRLVQRLFPAPWPEATVTSMEAAEEFLVGLTAEAKAEAAAQVSLDPGQAVPPAQAMASLTEDELVEPADNGNSNNNDDLRGCDALPEAAALNLGDRDLLPTAFGDDDDGLQLPLPQYPLLEPMGVPHSPQNRPGLEGGDTTLPARDSLDSIDHAQVIFMASPWFCTGICSSCGSHPRPKSPTSPN